MRTQKFQRVFDRIVRKLGRDPLGEVPQDMARAIVDHINERVETMHQAWDWPEWTVTEERAFRQVWNSTHQYKRVNDTDLLPDEVFYLGAAFSSATGEFGTGYGYYRILSDAPSDPPVGTVPTNTTYWEAIDPLDRYIAYDQTCRRSIGRVLGVYNGNPAFNGCGGSGLCFRPTEKGISVRGNGSSTVFISYLMPLPEYTIIPYVAGKSYVRGDTVFDPDTGECFQALAGTTQAPTGSDWSWIPFPQKWATFVVDGAFADCLGEFDQGGNDDVQAKLGIAGKAESAANQAFEARIDALTSEGQVLKYSFCKPKCDCWCESIAFTGDATSVTTLTETCDTGGWVYPVPVPPSALTACDTTYHSEIVALLTATGTPSLQGLSTTVRAVTCTLITIVIDVGGTPESQQWRLDAGPANPLDAGEVAPADYNLATNNKKWVKVA